MTCGLFVCGFYENPSSSLFSKAVWGEKAAYSQQKKNICIPLVQQEHIFILQLFYFIFVLLVKMIKYRHVIVAATQNQNLPYTFECFCEL